jgi:hypothetical protein
MAGFMLFVGMLFVAAPASGGQGTKYEFDHYVLETDLPAERARFIGRVMDAAGKEYDRRFQGFSGRVRQKPQLRVFATKEAYLAALKRASFDSSNHEATAGAFNPLDGIVYTFEGPGLEYTLKHECFHQFASHVLGGSLPEWTSEGLAEYFGSSAFDDKTGQLRLGTVSPQHVAVILLARQRGAMIPVEELLQITAREWADTRGDDVRGPLQYAQSWALCHFLVHGDGGQYRELFEQYLRHVDKGLDGDSAFKRVFGSDVRALQTKYDAYIDQLTGMVSGAQGR